MALNARTKRAPHILQVATKRGFGLQKQSWAAVALARDVISESLAVNLENIKHARCVRVVHVRQQDCILYCKHNQMRQDLLLRKGSGSFSQSKQFMR